MKHAGIVLCGGLSSRMGMPKLALPFGPESMLQRVARLLGEACVPIVVVAAPGQTVPPLAGKVLVVRDRDAGRGPLEGLRTGLAALPSDVAAAYVTGCDAPLLAPAFVRRMFELLGDHSIAVPVSGGYQHPLAAVYRPALVDVIERLLAADRLRPAFLFDSVATRRVEAEELRDVDPELATLRNVNRPEDYLAALEHAGFEPPCGM